MYKVHCPKCNNYNYSASRASKWVCCHCGEDLKNRSLQMVIEGRRLERLA